MPVDAEEPRPGIVPGIVNESESGSGTGAACDRTRPNPAGKKLPEELTWSDALLALLTTAAIIVVALVAPLYFGEIVNKISGLLGNGQLSKDPSVVVWINLLSFQATIVVLTVLMAGVSCSSSGAGLGWQSLVDRYSWVRPLLLTVAVSALVASFAFTIFPEQIERDLAPIRQMVASGPQSLALIALVVGAPLSEELLFRGYLLHRLRHTPLGFWGAALLANIGWTLLHIEYSWLSLADVFIAGLLFSWALWRTQSIWVPIAFHAIYNSVVFAVFLIPSSKSAVPAFWHVF
jgi:membrane protease YdiL (CAAX protease family)